MAKLEKKTLLLEIGTEELPPQEIVRLSDSLGRELVAALEEMGFACGEKKVYGTPRRLAVRIEGVPVKQDDREVERRGPTVDKAFDADGKPTAAGAGFAKSCGVPIEKVKQVDGRLVHRQKEKGRKLGECLNEALGGVVKKLPVSRRMRWTSEDYEFIRPVRWLCVVHGETAVKGVSLFGCESAGSSYGHRHHHPGKVKIPSADEYEEALEKVEVMPSFEKRRKVASELLNKGFDGDDMPSWEGAMALEEFAYSLEWPVALEVQFPKQFSTMPSDIVQQALLKDIGAVTAPYSRSSNPDAPEDIGTRPYCFVFMDGEREEGVEQSIVRGYERVVLARLADVNFFYLRDQKRTLESRIPELKKVVFEQHLGTLFDKTERIKNIAEHIVNAYINDADTNVVRRAAALCKCELVTELVKERPDLEGYVGRHYARFDGESSEVCEAIREHWLPRRSQDVLPKTLEGVALALADRLDTLVGILSTGESPTGSRDPFGLRRIAIAIIRILIDKDVSLDLGPVLDQVYEGLPKKAKKKENGAQLAWQYIYGRLPTYYQPDQDDDNEGIRGAMRCIDQSLILRPKEPVPLRVVRAVAGISYSTNLFDIDRRVLAVGHFINLPEAESLIAANKRIANILRKQGLDGLSKDEFERKARRDFRQEFPDRNITYSPQPPSAMQKLEQCLEDSKGEIETHVKKKDYLSAMKVLAQFAVPLEKFFDEVIVLSEHEQERLDRLSLLRDVRELFLSIADFSELGGELGGEDSK